MSELDVNPEVPSDEELMTDGMEDASFDVDQAQDVPLDIDINHCLVETYDEVTKSGPPVPVLDAGGQGPPTPAKIFQKFFSENDLELSVLNQNPGGAGRPAIIPTILQLISYCVAVAKTGLIGRSSAQADATPQRILIWRKALPVFNQAVEFALELYKDSLLEEAHVRGATGWREPVFQGGKMVGTILKKSDRMLEALLKKHDPSMRDGPQTHVQVGGVLVVPQTPRSDEDWIRDADAAAAFTRSRGAADAAPALPGAGAPASHQLPPPEKRPEH